MTGVHLEGQLFVTYLLARRGNCVLHVLARGCMSFLENASLCIFLNTSIIDNFNSLIFVSEN